MRITLVYLPHPFLVDPTAQPPLGLLYIASCLEQNTQHEVILKNYSAYSEEEALKDLPESEVYGITVTALELLQANDFAKQIKAKYPDSKVILGGPGTFCDEYVDWKYIDSILKGEGEITFAKMLEDLANKKLNKIYHGEVVQNLDDIPFPARHLLVDKQGGHIFANHKTYDKTFSMQYKNKGTTAIMTSRGCPFKCLSGDTLIETIEGRIPIKNLVGREIKVLTRNKITLEPEFANAYNICKTQTDAEILRVNFDDSTYIDCTPDHKFLTFKNGNQFSETTEKEVEAKDLKYNMSLRAIHYDQDVGTYIRVNWGRRKSKPLHRLIMEGMLNKQLSKKEFVHHIDHNKQNNNFSNLQLTDIHNHISIYHPEVSERMKLNNPAKYLSKEHFIKLGKMNKGIKRSKESKLKYRLSKLREKNPNWTGGKPKCLDCQKILCNYDNKSHRCIKCFLKNRRKNIEINHKVLSIQYLSKKEDVYCMEVPGYDWFYANQVLVHNCSFCSAPSLNLKMRYRSPENVYKEIKHVLDTYKIKQFRLSDEMFTANKKHVLEICELIKPLGVVWRISARVKPLSLEILKAMKDAGCVEISFGIESFDNEVLKILNKKTTAEDNANALKMAKEVGLMTRALFMIRTPGQSKNTVPINIEWLKKVSFDTIAVTSYVPLPGSAIWDDPDKYNIEILNTNLSDFNFYFYGKEGKNELKDIIKIKDRSLEEFNRESNMFRDWIENEGKVNHG